MAATLTSHPSTAPMGTAVALEAAELLISIVSYQTAAEVGACIASLRAHPPAIPWHLVVIDNASPDGSVRLLQETYRDARDVTILASETNLGFGQANNRVAALSSAPYLALVNPDCTVLADGLTPAVRYLAANAQVGVIGPQVLRTDGKVEATARTFPTPTAGLAGRRSLLRKLWPNNPWSLRFMVEHRASNGALPVDWVAGTVMVLRRQEFLDLGGFDPAYFLYWEDCDLCWRYKKLKNLWTVYLPEGAIAHASNAAGGKVPAFAIREFHKAAYTLVVRHLAPSPWHPLRWFAWAMLGSRSLWLQARASKRL